MSFAEDAYSTNPIGASEQEVAETIVSARKSWKTVKGKSEPVWPPALEKALVKGACSMLNALWTLCVLTFSPSIVCTPAWAPDCALHHPAIRFP